MLKRSFVSLAAASVVIGSAAGMTLSGCADNEGSFFVLNAIAGTSDEGGCLFDPGAPILFGGSYEVLGGAEYSVGLVARSALVPTENPTAPRVEANHVEIYAVEVEVVGKGILNSPDCPASFTYPSKGFVEPGQDGVTQTLVIPGCMRSQINAAMAIGETQTVIATFVVRGHTTGGNELESPEYDFPIRVSRGALCGGELEDGAVAACGFGVNSVVPTAICEANAAPAP